MHIVETEGSTYSAAPNDSSKSVKRVLNTLKRNIRSGAARNPMSEDPDYTISSTEKLRSIEKGLVGLFASNAAFKSDISTAAFGAEFIRASQIISQNQKWASPLLLKEARDYGIDLAKEL